MIISELSVDYMSFDDDDKEISAIAISYKDNRGKEQRRWLEKPRRIGHWSKKMRFTEDFMENRTYGYKCSVCGKIANRLPFCGNCGAKMDESEVKK